MNLEGKKLSSPHHPEQWLATDGVKILAEGKREDKEGRERGRERERSFCFSIYPYRNMTTLVLFPD